jgi:chemotaxis methyl-accepting protein methylase
MLLAPSASESVLTRMSQVRFLRKYVGRPYRLICVWTWKHLPASFTSWSPVRACGAHLHRVIQQTAKRQQFVATYFFRNRPELELLVRLLARKGEGSTVDMTIIACSKGAEVYSFSYAIRSARGGAKVNLRAVDIEKDMVEFAKAGIYSLPNEVGSVAAIPRSAAGDADVVANTIKHQEQSIFDRISPAEMEALFDHEGDQVRVKPRFREGISWHLGDATDPGLVHALGLQDIVIANRFLCHMPPKEAEACLRNLARLVKPGGYLFVSGVDLDVRSKVARELGWKPMTELLNEMHEGDPSLRAGWPLEYWALEPINRDRADWQMRYASVFQLIGR